MAVAGSPQRYESVAATVRAQITAGTHPVGSELPTVDALAAEFGVSHMTIKKALSILSAEGVIATHRGARTRVSALPQKEAKPLAQQVSELHMRVDGLDARLTALESHASKRNSRGRA
jgi:DNA-binding GntR family transcriptional regulator